MIAAVKHAGTRELATVRRTMAGMPSNFAPPSGLDGAREAWRRVQVRQLFRLSLETLLYWMICQVENGPKSTESLVSAFLAQAGQSEMGPLAQGSARMQMHQAVRMISFEASRTLSTTHYTRNWHRPYVTGCRPPLQRHRSMDRYSSGQTDCPCSVHVARPRRGAPRRREASCVMPLRIGSSLSMCIGLLGGGGLSGTPGHAESHAFTSEARAGRIGLDVGAGSVARLGPCTYCG